MKAISIRQPWAWLVVNGIKSVENRSWKTSYRGDILVHAAKSPGLNKGELEEFRKLCAEDGINLPPEFEYGGIVGVVEIIDCTLEPEEEYDQAWHQPGMYAWLLDRAAPLPFVPFLGKLHLFEVPDELINPNISPGK